MIFVMIIYVYPPKMMLSGIFHWVSGGWLPTRFTIGGREELTGLFVIYGPGFFAMGCCLCLHYVRWRRERAGVSPRSFARSSPRTWMTRPVEPPGG